VNTCGDKVIGYDWDLNPRSFDPGPKVLTTRPQISTWGQSKYFEFNHRIILYIQRLPQCSLTRLFWPCWHPLWFRVGLHSEARWPIRSRNQACNLQFDSNRPVRHLSLAPNSSILNKPRLLPLIHARLPVSQQWTQWTSVIHQPRPWPLYWWTHSLKIKYLHI
jgi:hypothetical protein